MTNNYLDKDTLTTLIDLIKDAFSDVHDDIETLNTVGLIVNEELIQGFIDDWLEDHPDATTTIADGSVSYASLATALKNIIDAKADASSIPTNTNQLTNGAGFITSASLPHIERGVITVTPKSKGRVTTKAVTFSSAFSSVPNVVVTPRTTVPDVINCGVSDITTTGFNLYMTRTNTTTTYFQYIAIGG